MPEPTDEQLRDYANLLPDIYKQILDAFAKASSSRRANESLNLRTIRQWVDFQNDFYRDSDVREAIGKMKAGGFLENHLDPNWPSEDEYRPTELGERLVTALTGVQPIKNVVPDLPDPGWSR